MAILIKAKALKDCHVGGKLRMAGQIFTFIGPMDPLPSYLEHIETLGAEATAKIIAAAEKTVEEQKEALWAEVDKLGIRGSLHPNTGVKKLKEAIDAYKAQTGLDGQG